MAEQTAVRPEETRSKEDTIRKWLSRLLSLKAPNHQIIEVPLPADAGETESQNDCITTPPAPAATATTPSHPHSGEELPPPQSEKPIPKDLTSSHRLPTDRHEVSQPILDRTPQQVPAEDDRATQNGDKAHTLQSTHPRTKDKGKTIARITNDAGLSSINVPVSANVPTAQCDLNAPAIQAYPVEIPYSKTFTERLSKVENLYMDKTAIIAPAINSRWKNEIQRKLDKDLQDLIKAKFGAKDNILSTAQLYMVGSKHKKTLAVKPTIIITCGTMESKKWIAEELSNLKLHYLDDFGCPWRVRYEPKPTSWTASPPDETPSTPFGTMGHDIPNLQGVYVEQNIKPGVSGLKLRFDVLQDGITQHRYATLGGIISINDANLLMTTAHPFLAELDSGNEPLVSDDMEASMSDSDSNSQSDSEMAEPPNIPRTSLPFDQMRYSRLWTSEQWTRVAYSFLGRISLSNAGNAVNLQWPSSSDWALFQVRERSLLSKSQISPQFSSFITEDRLTPGEVKIIDTVDALSAGFLTQTAVSIHTAKAVMHVREILLSGVLSNGASGAWVVRGSDVCGYVVAATGSRKSCFMVPMYCAFDEIEAAFGAKPKLGVEQVDPSEEEVVGASYDNGIESTSDDHPIITPSSMERPHPHRQSGDKPKGILDYIDRLFSLKVRSSPKKGREKEPQRFFVRNKRRRPRHPGGRAEDRQPVPVHPPPRAPTPPVYHPPPPPPRLSRANIPRHPRHQPTVHGESLADRGDRFVREAIRGENARQLARAQGQTPPAAYGRYDGGFLGRRNTIDGGQRSILPKEHRPYERLSRIQAIPLRN